MLPQELVGYADTLAEIPGAVKQVFQL